jgi:ribose transport system substrate-binding protein
MKPNIVRGAVAAAALALALTACSTGASSSDGGQGAGASGSPAGSSGSSVIDLNLSGTVGPNGEDPTPVSDLTLTDDEVAKLQAGHYTAAQLWHTSSQFVDAVQQGAAAEFSRLGIEVVATTNANMDAGTQANQVQTAMAKKPDVIVGLPVDPTSAAAAFQPAVDAGTKLVFLSNVPEGYTYGQQYTSIVTDDLYDMGKRAAEALGESLGGKGTVGLIYYNAQYYVTNQRDAAFRTTLRNEYPDIEVVAEQGFSDANNVTSIASGLLTQHPDLAGIYTSWAQPAEGVLAALRTVGNTTTKVVTLDLDDPVVVDMASGGSTVAVVADEAFEVGRGMADAAAYALLGKTAPPFVVAKALTITKDTIPQGYQQSLHSDVPEAVKKVLD